ncbi:MAG TPA: NAD(P)/FAD-dependent oxidoreductase [Alphaproteobacteria bacterium]|nr:NAD(P)/FAD-dependent oxidoreductase [Alphaproteobacteria bacterium]HOO50742.1 NAD(P)/FAD-dependent oxidoreductase [Alphaproteobacteria bacterium]
MSRYDTIVIGAGAAGLMAAARIGQGGKSVLILDHSETIGEKIRISGGGRCNFTNIHTKPANFLSSNPHFCKSALARFTPKDFIALVEQYGIAYHDKGRGQLFCDGKSQQIIDMLVSECEKASVRIIPNTIIENVDRNEDGHYKIETSRGPFVSNSLVIATGGLSIPKTGATPFGYRIAEQFGLSVIPPRAALVPFMFSDEFLSLAKDLSGISVDPCVVKIDKTSFEEAILFTHRGLSGPAILQISSYWKDGDPVHINLLPHRNMEELLKTERKDSPKKMLRTVLEHYFSERLAHGLAKISGVDEQMGNLSDKKIAVVSNLIHNWTVKPCGTEGYRTAEVTLGGVDTNSLSSKTMEARDISGLYFIGEVVDVTGQLGGFNFQWAWSSAVCCADAVLAKVS